MRRIAPLVLVLTTSLAAVPGADAYWSAGSPLVVAAFGCSASRTSGDAVAATDGSVRGFVRPERCGSTRPRYVERVKGVWRSTSSPYNGRVLAVADDGTRTYLLYAATDGVRLGTRSRSGTYTASRRLSTVVPRAGDVAAYGGTWWAVWSEGTALYQARTMGPDLARQRVTTSGDANPTLARLSDGSAVLAFQRRDAATGRTDVFRARSTGGAWSFAKVTSNGTSVEPSIAARGARQLLAWSSAGRIGYADDTTGAWRSRLFATRGTAPRVTTSGSRVFVAWTSSSANAVLAERSGDVWAERNVTPGDAGGSALAVTAHAANATVLVAERTRVVARAQARPSITAFRGHGAWIDLFDVSRDAAASVATMKANNVRTLYIETARYDSSAAIGSRTAAWLDAAKSQGLRAVAWYLPAYSEYLDRDVARTVAAARYRTPAGNRFDAIGVDIEYRGASSSGAEFNSGVVSHLRRVRAALGASYPIAAITPSPLGMALNAEGWAGFPWAEIGRLSDVAMPMAYWSYRTDCPAVRQHCAYEYTRGNVSLSARYTGLPVHVIGGVGNDVTTTEVADFVRGVEDSPAIGGGLYDFATTKSTYWPYLKQL